MKKKAGAALFFSTPFATRCPKKAKSCRNAHKTGAAGATAQLGLPGLLWGRNPFQNRVIQALVCTFSPANTLATPVSLQLTADAIMQDLHGSSRTKPAAHALAGRGVLLVF